MTDSEQVLLVAVIILIFVLLVPVVVSFFNGFYFGGGGIFGIGWASRKQRAISSKITRPYVPGSNVYETKECPNCLETVPFEGYVLFTCPECGYKQPTKAELFP